MRNNSISIVKGIAIILMVVGHAEAPELLTNCIYTFHMPLFFITAGYFFSRKYLSDPFAFISKRVKGLYFPFLKWSFIFLLLHNLWFEIGLLNEEYGNWTGGVTHPYTLRQMAVRGVLLLTSMSGYDEFIAGAFWFFRGLLVASVMFLLLYKLLDSRTSLSSELCVAAICAGCVAFTAIHIGFGVKLSTIPNGGWRETWGIFFFGVGVLYRRYESWIGQRWWLALICAFLIVGAGKLHLSGMNNHGLYRDLWSLPLTGFIGFIAVRYLAGRIDAVDSRFRRMLIFIGENTLFVFVFHILSFKAVSLLKVWYYDMPFGQVGCHMVIHEGSHQDMFWVLYSIAGVAIPLGALLLWRRLKNMAKSSKMPFRLPDLRI